MKKVDTVKLHAMIEDYKKTLEITKIKVDEEKYCYSLEDKLYNTYSEDLKKLDIYIMQNVDIIGEDYIIFENYIKDTIEDIYTNIQTNYDEYNAIIDYATNYIDILDREVACDKTTYSKKQEKLATEINKDYYNVSIIKSLFEELNKG